MTAIIVAARRGHQISYDTTAARPAGRLFPPRNAGPGAWPVDTVRFAGIRVKTFVAADSETAVLGVR